MFAAGSPDRPRHARCRASAFVSNRADCRGVVEIGSSKSTLARVLVVLEVPGATKLFGEGMSGSAAGTARHPAGFSGTLPLRHCD
ncbi:hypothetical protein GGE09_004581 [Roseobacter sp. N2S]|jgi:hypothetical protein|nr:hypothetical protein [Roseobacter sp. N2S]